MGKQSITIIHTIYVAYVNMMSQLFTRIKREAKYDDDC